MVDPFGSLFGNLGSSLTRGTTTTPTSTSGAGAAGRTSSQGTTYGIKDVQGYPLHLRDSQLASYIYNFAGTTWANPKPKFMFYVQFHLQSQDSSSGGGSTVGFVAKNIDIPNTKIKTEMLNQYNKKRVVQTIHEHDELNIRFYDTVDNTALTLWLQYYLYYYGDPRNRSTGNWTNDVVAAQFQNPSNAQGWGYQLPQNSGDQAPYFSSITVYQFFNGTMNQWDFANPIVTSFNHDELDVTQGTAPQECTMHFAFEGVIQTVLGQPIPDELAQSLGLPMSSYYEVGDVQDSSHAYKAPTSILDQYLAKFQPTQLPVGSGDYHDYTTGNPIRSNLSTVDGVIGTVLTGSFNPLASSMGVNNIDFGPGGGGLRRGIQFGNQGAGNGNPASYDPNTGLGSTINDVDGNSPINQNTFNAEQMGQINEASYPGFQVGYNGGQNSRMLPVYQRGYQAENNRSGYSRDSNQRQTWDRQGNSEPGQGIY